LPIQPAEFHVYPDADDVAWEAATWLCRVTSVCTERMAICLSGGSTPKRMYECLKQETLRGRFPWDRVHWFWGDERFVPPEDSNNNCRMVREAMLDDVGVAQTHIHPIPTVAMTPADAASAYARTLQDFYGAATLNRARPMFNVTLLGLGEDGHTASLFPGSAVLEEREAWVASVVGARPEPRITLTYPTLESSSHVAFLVCGEAKRKMVDSTLRGASVPAAGVRPVGRVHWFLDSSASPNFLG
jgi:6-phosphogluconolactonase